MSTREHLIISFAQKYSILAIRMCALIVLSRLLGPSEFGLFLATAAIIAIANVIADCGIYQFVIQAQEFCRQAQRSVFGLSIASALLVFTAVQAFAHFAPAAFLDDSLRNAISLLAVSFLSVPFATLGTARLQRELRFKTLCWIATIAALTSVSATIALAYFGYGFMSLVWGALIETISLALLVAPFNKGIIPSFLGWRPILNFSRVWVFIGGIGNLADALNRLIVQAFLGYAAVGLLGRAESITLLFNRAILDALNTVLLPTLAARLRSGDEVGHLNVRIVSYLSATAWPFFAVVAVCAQPLVSIVLGNQWSETVPLVQLLCVNGLFLPFVSTMMEFFVARRELTSFLPVHVASQIFKVLAVLCAAQYSIALVCCAFFIEGLIRSIFGQRLVAKRMGLGLHDYAKPLLLSLATAAVTGFSAGLAMHAVGANALPIVQLAAAGTSAAVTWLVAIAALNHPITNELRALLRPLAARASSLGPLGAKSSETA